jgi:hypothetical protein
MRNIKIIIERSVDSYWAYAENVEGINGVGDTVEKAKDSALACIKIQQELGNIPNRQLDIVFKFDTQSFLQYYKGIFTNAAFEKLTGINQKQIQHYASGHRKPRPAQAKKIESALHKLGQELMAVEL